MKDFSILQLMARQPALTEKQQALFCALIKGRNSTQLAASRLVALSFAQWFGFYWLGRFYWLFDENTPETGFFQFCAGQSYPDGLARVRADIRRHYG